jgi:hypothetical protein
MTAWFINILLKWAGSSQSVMSSKEVTVVVEGMGILLEGYKNLNELIKKEYAELLVKSDRMEAQIKDLQAGLAASDERAERCERQHVEDARIIVGLQNQITELSTKGLT